MKESFYAVAAMAMMSGALSGGYKNYPHRTITHEEAEKKYRPFRRKREDETDEEYKAAWREEYKFRLQRAVAKKGLTVYEINGELIPAKNEREAQKRYKPDTSNMTPTTSYQIGPYTAQVLAPGTTTEAIRKQLMNGREMLIRPAAEWQQFSWSEQRMLLHETATFVAPTEELVDWLDQTIGQESAIEICCGNGWIGRELDIPITDSKEHERADVKLLYALMNNPRIHYPADVRQMEAIKAVNRFHPHTVIACYHAFKWEPAKQIGSDYGVDFQKLLRRVKRLIIVGNDHVHGAFSFMQVSHKTIHIPGLITRDKDREADNIYIWEN